MMNTKLTKLKIVLIAVFFLAALTGARLLWIGLHNNEKGQSVAIEGILDLSGVKFDDSRPILLNGEWEFYPNMLLSPEAFHSQSTTLEKIYMQVPGGWNQFSTSNKDAYEYGTYRLRLIVDEEVETSFGIRLSSVGMAFQLFADGEMVGGRGEVTKGKENYIPKRMPFYTTFLSSGDEIELIMQVSNPTDYVTGSGIEKMITFGNAASIEGRKWFSIITQLIVCAILLVHLIYAGLLYLIGIKQRILVYFSLIFLITILTVLVDGESILFYLFPLDDIWATKCIYFLYVGESLFFVQFFRQLFQEYSKLWILKAFSALCVGYMFFVLIMPIGYVELTSIVFSFIFTFSPFIILILILRIVLRGGEGNIFFLLAAISVASGTFWGLVKFGSEIQMGYYPFDMLASIIALSAYWFQGYFQSTIKTKKLSEKLQRANDQKDDFLANTSHELRNPLHGIMNIAQTVLTQESDKLDVANKENLKLLVSIGDHMSFMLNDLLDLTQLKHNAIVLQTKSLQIQTVARGVCDMLRFMVDGKPVQLLVEIEEDFPNVVADENRLLQILFNLVNNAIKYTNEGTITIRAHVEGKEAYISVEDTGVGMDAVIQERIFERYEQADTGMTAVGGGLGLGLSICKEFVELHGGRITVTSVSNQGSTFTFTLPLSNGHENIQETPALLGSEGDFIQPIEAFGFYANEQAATYPEELTTISANRPRILVVDDDPINLHVLVHALATEDYEVETALRGEEALEKLQNGTWDLLITDIMMPQMSGYELARIVRGKFTITELPIIFLTARVRREDIFTAFLSGANDYVTKPVDAIELKARVQALIHLKRSIEDRFRLEAAWLQAQINPHFFFNILNSIYILSEIDEEKMRELLEAFSEYLHTSFDFQNTESVVPLEYELNLVRSYLSIEQIRFGDRVQVTWDIDENSQFTLPPLSMQTLVENAIQHGLLMQAEGGEITIRIIESEEYFQISISDDGVGFDKELVFAERRERGGVGIPNTDRRLQQLYGTGLQIDSQPGQGTTISFEIPKGDC